MTQRDHEIEELAAFYGLPIAEMRAELAKHERLRRDSPIPAEAQVRAIAARLPDSRRGPSPRDRGATPRFPPRPKSARSRRDSPIPAEAQVRAIAAECGVDP